jgi:hypothetical protein
LGFDAPEQTRYAKRNRLEEVPLPDMLYGT